MQKPDLPVKYAALVSLVLIMCPLVAVAGKDSHVSGAYLSYSAEVYGFFFHPAALPLSVSFPYQLTDGSGNISSHQFDSRATTPTPAGADAEGWSIEIGGVKGYGMAAFETGDGIMQFGFGYGRNLYFDVLNLSRGNDNYFVFKPSLGVCYNNFRPWGDDKHGGYYLGTIDNKAATIDVLGRTAYPTYLLNEKRPRTSPVIEAKTLDFYYFQRDWALVPKLTLSNNPYTQVLHWAVSVGWDVPVVEQGGLAGLQNNSRNISHNNLIALDHADVRYDGMRITKTPYHFSGFCYSLQIGFNVSGNSHYPRAWSRKG